eukprot:CAMPEP_0119354814 /NCGR_PEP_ID=MMETSP1334-20130426/3791_1 /TAXON_ID=127549 /ORGANISM="Calcidiscus leptoporus, Strain RCC1130" /LENGTH=95 /DNA_ID=CAMNT_0007368489 /DNA_START=773 /DNA_END=1061 /DNA_ORIENTATION=+
MHHHCELTLQGRRAEVTRRRTVEAAHAPNRTAAPGGATTSGSAAAAAAAAATAAAATLPEATDTAAAFPRATLLRGFRIYEGCEEEEDEVVNLVW